jgi:2-polyprenyl-3-methyl-5-hydroxy-6-metoxy-1,4-benzoquinol methylase
MATVAEHYDKVLARHYSKLVGEFDAAVNRQAALLDSLGIQCDGKAMALDLGCGSGLHALAFARRGFLVTAVDQNAALLEELKSRSEPVPLTLVHDDMGMFVSHTTERYQAITCMGDSLAHLEKRTDADSMLSRCADCLCPGGSLVLTFRDLTKELKDSQRFVSLYQDADTIMTCFLEYESETVKVHDLIHERGGDDTWRLNTSFYRKLRLHRETIADHLQTLNLTITCNKLDQGLVVLAAQKPRVNP